MADNNNSSFLPFFGRLFWMLLGPTLLLVLAFVIVGTGNGWLTGADFGYLGILAAVMVARWLEFRAGNPRTSVGEPATQKHLYRYLVGVAVVGLAVWVAANVLGNHVLTS
jgi:hypothetical protein